MPEIEVTTVPVRGTAAPWDPADPEAFIRLAGTRYLRTEGEVAVIANENGATANVYPGWAVLRPDGSGDDGAIFIAPAALHAWGIGF